MNGGLILFAQGGKKFDFDPKDLDQAMAQMQNLVMIAGVVGLVIGLFFIACWWVIFSKAGKPGWAAIIPIYNAIVFLDIAGKPWWWLILLLIPCVNIIIAIIAVHGLSRNFGQGALFTIGLLILPIIFLPLLAFGGFRYQGNTTLSHEIDD